MKLAADERVIERHGTERESRFSILGTSKAFKILSSSLYKDKFLAIIRELSCNAYDAHVFVGKQDVPFEVHLPNSLEPFLSIRDYGPGLSDEDVFQVYTTYFESTKTGSNDFIGALGLGSKSPFSYVDAYTVISRQNGNESSFSLFIDDDGCPSVTKIASCQTDESDGVEVVIPVETVEHFREFQARARTALEFFNPMPKVTGYLDFQPAKYDTVLQGDGFKVTRRDGGARAIMGKIAYPIDLQNVAGSNDIRFLVGRSLDIEFPLGSLEFTAGREELSYDRKHTLPALHDRLTDISKQIYRNISEKIAACKTEREARRTFGEILSTGLIPDRKVFLWNGVEIGSVNFKIRDPMVSLHYLGKYDRRPAVLTKDTNGCYNIPSESRIIIVWDDLPRGCTPRVKYHMTGEQSAVIISGSEEEVNHFMNKMNGFDLIRASELPKTPRGMSARNKVSVKVISGSSLGSGYLDGETPVDLDLEDSSGYYVITRSSMIEGVSGGNSRLRRENLLKLVRGAIAADLFDPKKDNLYFVPVSISKNIVESENWTNLIEHMKENLFKHIEKNADDFPISRNYEIIPNGLQNNVASIIAKILPDHPIAKLVGIQKVAKEARERIATLIPAMEMLRIDAEQFYRRNNIEVQVGKWDAILKRYPLVSTIVKSTYHYNLPSTEDLAKQFSVYIKAVDAEREPNIIPMKGSI